MTFRIGWHNKTAMPELLTNRLKRRFGVLFVVFCLLAQNLLAAYPDRFVFIFGWGLGSDKGMSNIIRVLDTASRHHLNGAVMPVGLGALSKKKPAYLRRLKAVQAACERDRLELIPAVFSVGHGGGILSLDPNLAEGFPVVDAPFVVKGNEAHFVPDPHARLVNGGFEKFHGNRFPGFDFIDRPGKVSFADTQIKHGGRASLRLENFASDPGGQARAMQTVRVTPHRCYRVTLWVKTGGLRPWSAFHCHVLAGGRELAPCSFHLPATGDWRKISFIFNSLGFDRVKLYAGLWRGRAGKIWLDDWSIEDAGPVNVLHRPGTPVTVRSADGAITYTEGRDYAPLTSPDFNVWRGDSPPAVLQLLPGSRIRDGERLRVSWYHPMLINNSQVSVCMAAPELYEIFDRESKLLAEWLHPRAVLLEMDEIRSGGTCRACAGRNMGELLGECVTRAAAAIRRYSPHARIYVWADMFDPTFNAQKNYYLVKGDFAGSWEHVPRDLIMAVWGREPREQSLKFFAKQGFPVLVACYYDESNLDNVKRWMEIAKPFSNVRGFMYTPWLKKYGLLPAFGGLLK